MEIWNVKFSYIWIYLTNFLIKLIKFVFNFINYNENKFNFLIFNKFIIKSNKLNLNLNNEEDMI